MPSAVRTGRDDPCPDPGREGGHGRGMVAATLPKRRRPLVLVPSARYVGTPVDRRRPGLRGRGGGAAARGASRVRTRDGAAVRRASRRSRSPRSRRRPSPSPTPSASASAAPSSVPSGGAFHVGEPAPPLVVPQVGGGTIDLANLKGKPVWVNFMATWCPSCQDEFPLMNGFAARYADDGPRRHRGRCPGGRGRRGGIRRRLGATFPLGLDSDRAAADAWDAIALPVHFWIDADGIVRDGALGGIGPDVMVEGLKSIMPGVDVTP